MTCARCGDRHENDGRRLCDECVRRCRCGKIARPKRGTCSDECFASHPCARPAKPVKPPRVKPPPKQCKVCGKPAMPKRKTCSDACWKADRDAQTEMMATPGRSPSRRRHHAARYKSSDKADVVARMVAEQNGCCACCGGEGMARGDGTTGLVLDHDHVSGTPRAMLCTYCNTALGMMQESPERIEALWKYAMRWSQRRGSDVA